MAKKQYFLTIDTETTMESHVADFGAVLSDRKGNIIKSMGVLVSEYYGKESLFFDKNSALEIWTELGLKRRNNSYLKMLESGERMIASTRAINKWLALVKGEFNPELTAYNLAFDLDKCKKSNIDLMMFDKRFCLWHLASYKYAKTKKYLNFILQHHYFNPPTSRQNMSYKTNAEVMARFVTGVMLEDEPHTALEDIIYYELPILTKIINTRNWREKIKKYDWQNFQVKDHFTASAKHVVLTDDLLRGD
jgi:hypothetical protein